MSENGNSENSQNNSQPETQIFAQAWENSDSPNSQSNSPHETQVFAQVWEDNDCDSIYESVAAMELREEEDKLVAHQAHLRLLLMREIRVIEDIKQRRQFELDCRTKIDVLRAQVDREKTTIDTETVPESL